MKTVLGIDPGKTKIGLAVVSGQGKDTQILERAVCSLEELTKCLGDALHRAKVDFAVIGNGTNSKRVQELIREAAPSMAILIVDEQDTSIRARERYWEHNKRRGWRRFVPSSLLVPPVPIDDYVAAILAERAIHVE